MKNAIKRYEYITYKRDNLYIGTLMSLYSLHIFWVNEPSKSEEKIVILKIESNYFVKKKTTQKNREQWQIQITICHILF